MQYVMAQLKHRNISSHYWAALWQAEQYGINISWTNTPMFRHLLYRPFNIWGAHYFQSNYIYFSYAVYCDIGLYFSVMTVTQHNNTTSVKISTDETLPTSIFVITKAFMYRVNIINIYNQSFLYHRSIPKHGVEMFVFGSSNDQRIQVCAAAHAQFTSQIFIYKQKYIYRPRGWDMMCIFVEKLRYYNRMALYLNIYFGFEYHMPNMYKVILRWLH